MLFDGIFCRRRCGKGFLHKLLLILKRTFIHLPTGMAVAAGAGGMRAIVEYDGQKGSDPRSVIIMCEGFAIALAGMAVIGMLHKSIENEDDRPRFPKWFRLSLRIVVAIFWATLPFIPGGENNFYFLQLGLLGSTALLLVFLESYGRLKKITANDFKRRRAYIKRCKRRGIKLKQPLLERLKNQIFHHTPSIDVSAVALESSQDDSATMVTSYDLSTFAQDETGEQRDIEAISLSPTEEEERVEAVEAEGLVTGLPRVVHGTSGTINQCFL